MKNSDLRILQHIRQNARANLTSISRKTGIPVSTIFDRLKAHEGTFVRKFTALVDFSKLGYSVRANVIIKTPAQQREQLKNYLLAHAHVNNIFRINNGYDFLVECVFSNIGEIEAFMEHLELQFQIESYQVYHVLDDIAREKMLASDFAI